ncbi:hypothetical protein RCL_jg23686.t1 [Rhizophagus clarus]|uniref:Uncharacterized protein n=1 Tax=Rhizophagus clarus TaxID=94130 RepID=A0A8H3QHJ0_9GLOM|nr:hypothetical protein RCL_jg23686.t1 [Rhizophagus clarus]
MPFEHPQEVADDYERLLDSNEGSTFRTIFPMESFERWNERFIYNIRNISFPLFSMILRDLLSLQALYWSYFFKGIRWCLAQNWNISQDSTQWDK